MIIHDYLCSTALRQNAARHTTLEKDFLCHHTAQCPKLWPFQCITWVEPVWCKGKSWICEQSYGSWKTCPADGLKTRNPPHPRPCHFLPGLAQATVSYEAHTPPHLGQEQEKSGECMYSTLHYSLVRLAVFPICVNNWIAFPGKLISTW